MAPAGQPARCGVPAVQTNRQVPAPVPAGWYSSDAFTENAIAQIDHAVAERKPFFTYLAYNAPHGPLRAPRENVTKYNGCYDAGWDALRQARFQRMLAMGLVDEHYKLTAPEAEVARWDELPPKTRKTESRRMTAYSGMVDRLDEDIGKLIAHLRSKGILDDTLVIFMSDNGGDGSNGDIATYDQAIPWEPGGVPPSVSNGWAYLKNTPFRWYKSSAARGGVSVPLILRWPRGIPLAPGKIVKQRLHETDLYPTLLELVGATYPTHDGDRPLTPLYGHSLLPVLADASLPECAIHDAIFWEFMDTSKGLLKGNWKIASMNDGPWMLFDMQADPAESTDLAQTRPEMIQALSREWYDFAEHHTSMPPTWRKPIRAERQGWGFYRLRIAVPSIESVSPVSSAMGVPLDTPLSFTFRQPISFERSAGKTLRLYAVGDPDTAVWKATPGPAQLEEGSKTLTFTDLPHLKPQTTYYLLADAGWINVGGKSVPPINDGATWYRFRTGDR